MEKFVRHFASLGRAIVEASQELSGSVSMVNSETDLRIFVDENRTRANFPTKVEFRAYEQSQDVLQQKHALLDEMSRHEKETTATRETMEKKQNADSRIVHYMQTLIRGKDLTFE